ncbi:unnamed protein product [Chrysoparadoxa australica]
MRLASVSLLLLFLTMSEATADIRGIEEQGESREGLDTPDAAERDEDYLPGLSRRLLCWWPFNGACSGDRDGGSGGFVGGSSGGPGLFQCADTNGYCGTVVPEVSCCKAFDFCKRVPGHPARRECMR